MTVSAQTAVNSSTGNGVTTVFPYTFKIIAAADLEVSVDGVVKTLTTHYTVSGAGDAAGGNVTFLTAPASGTTVVRRRNMAYTRTVDYQEQGDLRSDVLNPDQDAPVLMIQQLAEQVGRAVKFPLGETAPDSIELPALADRTGMYLAFDANGEITPSAGTGTDAGLRTDLAASTGSTLVTFLQAGTGAAARLVQAKLRDSISVKDFGAVGDGTTDDTAAIQAAWDAANTAGGGSIYLPAGTYKVTSAINITGCDNVLFFGAGPDASIITSSSTTANVFSDTGTGWWRTFRDFTITSSVTRTAGAYFSLAGERRSLFDRIRMKRHFNGFYFAGFEQTELRSVSITDPSGAGTAIICGNAADATSGQGANLLISDAFIRGNDDVTQNAPTGNYGIFVGDVDAVFAINCDIGALIQNDLNIDPQTRSANHHFLQCYFDSTKLGDGVLIQGAGNKQQITFNGSWIASAGQLTGGNAEACGVRAYNTGIYQDVLFSGCRIYNCAGSGVLMEMAGCDFTFSGCNVYANGATAVTNRYGIFWSPASAATLGPVITGCRFGGSNAPNDLRISNNATKYTISGCSFQSGMSNAGIGGTFAGNLDDTLASVASATTLTISPCAHYVNVTGTTNIGGATITYAGHIVVLRFNGALTVIDDSTNLRLAGNFVTAANSTLTLICDGYEWREIARANT